jgi:long-chain acyl-CoA synthetase
VSSINHAHLSVIFATANHLPSLLKLAPKCPGLKLIVSIDDLSAEAKTLATTWAQAQGIEVRELRDGMKLSSRTALSL